MNRRPKDSPPSQAYFWTEEWQEGEREADEDIRLGRTKSFANVEDAIAWLDSGVGIGEDDDG